MKTVNESVDDALTLRVNPDAPSAEAVSPNWNVNISYTASGDIVEIEILDTGKIGLYPVMVE